LIGKSPLFTVFALGKVECADFPSFDKSLQAILSSFPVTDVWDAVLEAGAPFIGPGAA